MRGDELDPGCPGADRAGLLLARFGQAAALLIRKSLALIGLKPGHGHVLLRLADTGPLSQQALIEVLGVDPSVLVAILNDLERDGLARRLRDPADRRRHIVEMSGRGADLVQDVNAAITAVENELFADLTDGETATLHRLLARLRTGPGGDACDD